MTGATTRRPGGRDPGSARGAGAVVAVVLVAAALVATGVGLALVARDDPVRTPGGGRDGGRGVGPASVPREPLVGLPDRSNTGPSAMPTRTMSAAEFLRSGVCDRRRIVGDVHVEELSARSPFLGRRFTMTGCVVDQLFWSIDGDYGESRYPHLVLRDTAVKGGMVMVSPMRLVIDRSFVAGGFWAPCPNCTSPPQWSEVVRPMPVLVRDSLFVVPPGDPASGRHTEALHVMGTGVGYQFENTRFVQEGPYNGTQTAAIKFSGRDSRWTGVTFDFGATGTAAYYTVYIGGTGNVVEGCRVERGLASYVYPDEEHQARFAGCVDFVTGAPLSLP